MKKTMSFRLAAGIFVPFAVAGLLASCEKAPENQTGGEDRLIPSVTVTAGQAGETSLTFNLAPVNAAEVKYLVQPASEQAPGATAVMSDGKEADPTESKDYTEEGLVAATDYVIYAAARNSEGLTSLVAEAEMTTAAHVPVYPEITLSDVTIDGTTASFTYTLSSAESAYYLYLPSTEDEPSAEDLSSGGTALSTETFETVVIEGLSYSTSYVLYAVAKNADGYSSVASKPFETDAAPVDPPAVGDFYYNDGTWSSGNESPVSGKTVIGVVFKTGAAESDLSDYSQAGLDNVNGFAVALENVSTVIDHGWYTQNVNSFGFSSQAFDCTSSDQDDFSGYYNSLALKSAAENAFGSLTSDNCPAIYYSMVFFDDEYASPESSTGWYLPSLGQLKALYDVKDTVYSSLDIVGGKDLSALVSDDMYWSSTVVEATSGESVYCTLFRDSELEIVQETNLNRLRYVRPVLAF